MKRAAKIVVFGLILLALAYVVFLWRGSATGQITATYLCHTNVSNGFGVALVQVTNHSSVDYTITVQTEQLTGRGWGPISARVLGSPRFDPLGHPMGVWEGKLAAQEGSYAVEADLSQYSTGCSAGLAGHSNFVVKVLAPTNAVRFHLRYSRFPSGTEMHMSWALTRWGIPYPFLPKAQSTVVYLPLN